MTKPRAICDCGMEYLPNKQPHEHASDCPVLRDWERYEHARELEDDDRRAEERLKQLGEERT